MPFDIEDKINEKYAKGLAARISKFTGRKLDNAALEAIDAEVKDHAQGLRARGINFPQVRAIVLPIQGHVELVRADLELRSLQTIVRNLYITRPATKPNEMKSAFHHSFPHFVTFLDFAPEQVPALVH